MKHRFYGFIFVFCVIIVIAYFGYSFYNSTFFKVSLDTDTVEQYTYFEYLDVEGIAVRQEKVLYSDEPYVNITYSVENGDRVAKRQKYGAYTTVVLSEESKSDIAFYDKKIKQLSESLDSGTQFDRKTIESNIKSKIITFLNDSDTGLFENVNKAADSIQINFNQIEIKESGASYFENMLSDFESKRQEVFSSMSVEETKLTSAFAGFFYSTCDGYEYLNINDYSNLTVSDFLDLYSSEAEPIADNVTGKIQNSPEWKFYTIIPSSYSNLVYEGKSMNIEFTIDYSGSRQIPFTVEYVSRVHDGMFCVVFKCNMLNDYVFALRKEQCKLILKSYSGLKVPAEALKINSEGQVGVYVLSGKIILFKPVDIVYSTDTFCVVSPSKKAGNYLLKTKDQVILGGKDLFDGKIINARQ